MRVDRGAARVVRPVRPVGLPGSRVCRMAAKRRVFGLMAGGQSVNWDCWWWSGRAVVDVGIGGTGMLGSS